MRLPARKRSSSILTHPKVLRTYRSLAAARDPKACAARSSHSYDFGQMSYDFQV